MKDRSATVHAYLFTVLFLIAASPINAQPLQIISVSTLLSSQVSSMAGSVMGGTKLYFKGAGFSPMAPNNIVMVGPYPCRVAADGVLDGVLSCTTTPTEQGKEAFNLAIIVSVDTQSVTVANSRFSYRISSTPLLSQMAPASAKAGDFIRYIGIHRVLNLGINNGIDSGDVIALKVDSSQCSMFDIVQNTINPNAIGSITCRHPLSQEAGLWRVSQLVVAGWSQNSIKMLKSSFKSEQIEFIVQPTISGVSLHTGSTAGADVVITGTGFSATQNANSVSFDGTLCQIQSASVSEIKCRMAVRKAQDSAKLATVAGQQVDGYVSGSGFSYARYSITDIADKSINGLKTTIANSDPNLELLEEGFYGEIGSGNVYGTYYGQVLKGYFKAPVSGVYTFYAFADDMIEFSLNTVPGTKAVGSNFIRCSWAQYEWNQYLSDNPNDSFQVTLTEGQHYYMEAYHVNLGGTGFFKVGVSMPNSNIALKWQTHAVHKVRTDLTNDPEVMQFVLSGATGGTFNLSVVRKDPKTLKIVYAAMALLSFNASEAQFTAALNTFNSYQPYGVSVTRSMFDANNTQTPDVTLSVKIVWTAKIDKLRPDAYLQERFTFIDRTVGPSTFEQTRLKDHSPLMSGTFQMTVSGAPVALYDSTTNAYTQTNLPYNIGADALRTALRQLPGLGLVDVDKHGDSSNSATWIISYFGYNGPVSLSLNNANLVGGKIGTTPTVTWTERRAYSPNLLVSPIDARFVYTPSSSPKLLVGVNSIVSVCTGDCSYSFVADGPEVTACTLTTSSLAITLSNPKSETWTLNDIAVALDGQNCQVDLQSSSSTSFSCLLPTNPSGTPIMTAGQKWVEVSVTGKGILPIDPAVTPLDFPFAVSSITPNTAGANGGTIATLNGQGWPLSADGCSLNFCGTTQSILTITNTALTVQIPSSNTPNTPCNVALTCNSYSGSTSFTYSSSVSVPQIHSISPQSASPVLKGVLEIVGTGFGASLASVSVYLTNSLGRVYQLRVLNLNNTYIKAGIPGGLPGKFKVQVTIDSVGDAVPNPSTANDFTYELLLQSISPNLGSYYGGTLVTLTGKNIAPQKLQNLVNFGYELNTLCRIESVNRTHLVCRTPPANQYWSSLTQNVLLDNRLIQQAQCTGSCSYTYSPKAVSPTLDTLSAVSGSNGDNILITGTNLNLNTNTAPTVVFTVNATGQESTVPCSVTTDSTCSITVPLLESGLYQMKIRIDPIGETNGLIFSYQVSQAALKSSSISLLGGVAVITGAGLPTKYPSKAFNISLLAGVSPIALVVDHATGTQFAFRLPAGPEGTVYTIRAKSTLGQTMEMRVTQTQLATYTATLATPTASSLPAGQFTIELAKSNPSMQPASVALVSSNNPLFRVTLSSGSWTNNSTHLSFPVTLASGQYGIEIVDKLKGVIVCKALLNMTSSSRSATVQQLSYNGGTFEVTGTDITASASITVNGIKGSFLSASVNSALFSIPPFATEITQNQFNLVAPFKISRSQYKLTSDVGGSNPNVVVDDQTMTSYISSSATCFINFDFGANLGVKLDRIRLFPDLQLSIVARFLIGAVIEGSSDNLTYSTLATVDSSVHSGWNIHKPSVHPAYRYIRFTHTNTTSSCRVAELQLFGTVLSTTTVSPTSSFMSQVTFSDGFNVFNWPSAIEFRADKTAKVTSVVPPNGNVFGGYNIAVNGVNLNIGQATVMIDGVACTVVSATSTLITCTVGSRLTLPSSNSFEVTLGTNKAIIEASFRYVHRWSDIRTWGTDLFPIDDDMVYVPPGMHLLVDVSTPVLNGIVVEGGTLEFSDESDMQVHAGYITLNEGTFISGTQNHPYSHKLTFVMYGGYYGKQQPMFGNKGIGCMDCSFSLHGAKRIRTWSDLASTVTAGTNTLTVVDTIDWTVGEEIVVASTSFDHNEAEQRTIAAISGKTITVDKPFKYQHFSGEETYGTHKLPMRAEVGLLSRNIVVRGDPTSPQKDYGAHLMLTGSAERGLKAHVAYTEFTDCGQPAIIGRYCIHFHMAGDVSNSYVVGNSVHHSMARILTLHGVANLYAAWNVGYRVKGHNFFVEDGIEVNNLIEYNLVISSLSVENMMQTDISVASYWITNPLNHVRFNRAAGGDFYGFWYQIKPNPDGPSATSDVCPIGNRLGESHDNIAHSYVRFGLRIFKLWSRKYPCSPVLQAQTDDPWGSNPTYQSVFENYVLYKNGQSGVLAEQTGFTTFRNFTIAESSQSHFNFHLTNFTREPVLVTDCVLIGCTATNPPANILKVSTATGIHSPRSSGLKLNRISFYHFGPSTTILKTCSGCDSLLLYTNTGNQVQIDSISYTNVTGNYLQMVGMKRDVIYDLDGTYTKNAFDSVLRNRATVVSNFDHIAKEIACKQPTDAARWDSSLACDSSVTVRRVMVTNIAPVQVFNFLPMKVQLLSSPADLPDDNLTHTSILSYMGFMEPMEDKPKTYSLPYITGRSYALWWNFGVDFDHIALVNSERFSMSDSAVLFKFNYTNHRQLFDIGPFAKGILPNPTTFTNETIGSLDSSICENGEWQHDNNTRTLVVCASGRNRSMFEYTDVNAIICRYECPVDPTKVPTQTFVRLWSNATQWPQKRVPLAGENVTVPGNWTIIVDMDPAEADFMVLHGTVIIPDTRDVAIVARGIWLTGSLTAGNSTSPFQHKITFTLNGNKQDFGYYFDPLLAGNKIFVVTGYLGLFGVVPTVVVASLTASLKQGDTSMYVSAADSWKVGDSLSISPSFKNPVEFETVKITAISGKTVTFDPPIKHNHFGSTDEATINNQYGKLDTRTVVSHLNRNIKFDSGASLGWGYQIVVYGMSSDAGDLLIGRADLSGVEFTNGGQYDTAAGPLTFSSLASGNASTVSDSVFSNCYATCVTLTAVDSIVITNNVFFNARLQFVSVKQVNSFTFTRNMMVGVTKRPTLPGAPDLITCFSISEGLNFVDVYSVKDNVCLGSEGHGFILPFIPCDVMDRSPFLNNVVGSAIVGFLYNKIKGQCIGAVGGKAFGCTIGQLASPPGPKAIHYKNFIMADNERSMGLRFGLEGDDRTAYLSDSYITAISRPNCVECYAPGALKCKGNYGLRMLAVTINGETFPKMFGSGFDVICRQQVYDSKAFLTNVVFANFRHIYSEAALRECGSNVVFRPHPIASDLTGSHHLFDSQCVNCEMDAMGYFQPPPDKELGWFGGCGIIHCTGKNNYIIQDHTGTFFGQKGTLIANNSAIGDSTPGCTFLPRLNGHFCTREDFAVLQYESIAPDFNTRIMWPVSLRNENSTWTTLTNGYKEWNWIGSQPQNKRLGRFISIVQLQSIYNMTFASMPPVDMRLQIQRRTVTGNNSDWIYVKLHYPQPNSIRVQVGGQTVRPVLIADPKVPQVLDPTKCGSNMFFYDNYTIHFIVTGAMGCQVRVSLVNTIQLTATFAMDINDFFKKDGQTLFIDRMCALMGITDTSRLKIVGVYSGSVKITALIDEPVTSTVDTSQSDNSYQQRRDYMISLQQQLDGHIRSGALGSTFSQAGFGPLIEANTMTVFFDPEFDKKVQPDTGMSTSLRNALIILSCVVVVLLASVWIYCKYRSKNAQIGEDMPESVGVREETFESNDIKMNRSEVQE